MEIETDGHSSFLDIDVNRRPDSSLVHRIYRKPTHTNLYLNARSPYHPANNQTMLFVLVHRASVICDSDSLQQELYLLHNTILNDDYSKQQMFWALSPPKRTS
jgi:hypothetical protein